MGRMKYNLNAFYEMRREPRLVAGMERMGNRVRNACGDGYVMTSEQGEKKPSGRHRVSITTDTPEAMKDNADNNTLVRELFANGGI